MLRQRVNAVGVRRDSAIVALSRGVIVALSRVAKVAQSGGSLAVVQGMAASAVRSAASRASHDQSSVSVATTRAGRDQRVAVALRVTRVAKDARISAVSVGRSVVSALSAVLHVLRRARSRRPVVSSRGSVAKAHVRDVPAGRSVADLVAVQAVARAVRAAEVVVVSEIAPSAAHTRGSLARKALALVEVSVTVASVASTAVPSVVDLAASAVELLAQRPRSVARRISTRTASTCTVSLSLISLGRTISSRAVVVGSLAGAATVVAEPAGRDSRVVVAADRAARQDRSSAAEISFFT